MFFGKPSPKAFARRLQRAILAEDPSRKFRFDPESFSLIGIDDDAKVNLQNIYREYCATPWRLRGRHLRQLALIFGSSQNDLPDDFEEARPALRPKIWSRAGFALMELEDRFKGGDGLDLPLYPVGSHLYSSLVYDTEHSMRSIRQEELDNWGVTYYEALEIACQNLHESTQAVAKIGDHFCSFITGDSFDSARILLFDRIQSFEFPGEVIAIVPHRDAAYLASSDDPDAMRILFELTQKGLADQPRPLSPLPLKLEDGAWVDWVPPPDHPLREKFEELEAGLMASLYAEQQQTLNALTQDRDDFPFVASFSALQKPGEERIWSYCVWGEGVDALLPKTQLIFFANQDGQAAAGEWDHVAAIVGDLLVADESYYPIRYRVREFPSAEQLAAIGNI